MKDIDWLKTNYLGFLTERKGELSKSMESLYKQECVDEANFEKIKLNVVEIFSTMFSISFTDDPVALKAKYLSFFEKITSPWHLNREKALEFEQEMERIVEDVKIQEADELKIRFEAYFNQMDVDQRCTN